MTPNEIWVAGVRSIGHRGLLSSTSTRVAALCRHHSVVGVFAFQTGM